MKYKTTRFGEIEYDDQRILTFQEGLYGFSDYHKYILLNDKPDSPFLWLQSLEIPELAFILIPPQKVRGDYLLDISETDVAKLEYENETDLLSFVIVVIPPGKPNNMTANFKAPVIINTKSKKGYQMISLRMEYHTKHPIIEEMKAYSEGKPPLPLVDKNPRNDNTGGVKR